MVHDATARGSTARDSVTHDSMAHDSMAHDSMAHDSIAASAGRVGAWRQADPRTAAASGSSTTLGAVMGLMQARRGFARALLEHPLRALVLAAQVRSPACVCNDPPVSLTDSSWRRGSPYDGAVSGAVCARCVLGCVSDKRTNSSLTKRQTRL